MQQKATGLSVFSVPGLPLFTAGDDLADAILNALSQAHVPLQDGDVVVVAQKAVSKVEDRSRSLLGARPSPEAIDIAARTGKDPAIVDLVMQESAELMRVTPAAIITRHRTGHVLANAGIDASNVAPAEDRRVLLWPEDPDRSAGALRDRLQSAFDVRLAVIVSDSLGRAWRVGTTGTAIGVAGINPIRDRRGETDLFGRVLEATVTGIADEIAAAASLIMGEGAESTPVVVVRGARFEAKEGASVQDILRPIDQDLFR